MHVTELDAELTKVHVTRARGTCLEGDVRTLAALQERGEGYEQAVALQIGSAPLERCISHIYFRPARKEKKRHET